jgi:hypothetical protein
MPARTFAVMLVRRRHGGAFRMRLRRPSRELHAKGFRQPTPEQPPPEPELDVKELIRANADTLFTARPGTLAVARPKRITGRGFSACVKAVVAGPMNSPATTNHGRRDHRAR